MFNLWKLEDVGKRGSGEMSWVTDNRRQMPVSWPGRRWWVDKERRKKSFYARI